MIGKIQRVQLRDVWRHEALDFTTWLEDNIEVLGDTVNLTLTNVEREQGVGAFSVDLVAEDDSGNVIVIENQLEKSNHDHLGKLLTYLTALEARVGVWIVSDPRPEHVKAMVWLNESSAAAFYLVKVEAIRIGESLPAPLLTLITGPSEEAVETGVKKKELAERYTIRKKFWIRLLETARDNTQLHASISASQHGWIGTSAGVSGLGFNYTIRRQDGGVELYIDSDHHTGEGNTAIFNKLLENKEQIEEEFGGPLDWELLEGKRACRIIKRIDGGGWQDENTWADVQENMIDGMIRLEKALRPHLNKF